ncbi:tetraacyldisaccharide 4'-kinase [Labilibacter sediminis]|nr:tetraacyldisaccharide 4'-kinase [Labilibacter sediminis]
MKFVKYIRLILFPIALVYGLVIRIRNRMFDKGKLPVQEYQVPLISVGNITVGGTGKTPLTEFIIKTLQQNYSLALLSRGYKRKTKGVVLADPSSTAYDIGDEPKQIKDKFERLQVAVAEKRVEGVNELLALPNPPEVIVMDDAYQHRYVKPGLSILVMDYNRPLWRDVMLPAGDLREPMNGKRRADIILVSKCPSELNEKKRMRILSKLKPEAHQSVFFSTITYQKPEPLYNTKVHLSDEALLNADVLLVTGIANPASLFQYLSRVSKQVHTLYYPDHYQFNAEDLEKIQSQFNKINSSKKIIMTTEKDSVRFRQVLEENDSISKDIWYVPIEIQILNNQQNQFTEKIMSYVKENKRNR